MAEEDSNTGAKIAGKVVGTAAGAVVGGVAGQVVGAVVEHVATKLYSNDEYLEAVDDFVTRRNGG